MSWRKAEGVWFSTVTFSRVSKSWNCSGERLMRWGMMTRRPPYKSAPQISQTEKSKAMEWNMVHTSCGPKRNQASVLVKRRTTFWWVMQQPLGWPVEPEV